MEIPYHPPSYMYEGPKIKELARNMREQLGEDLWNLIYTRHVLSPQNYLRHELLGVIFTGEIVWTHTDRVRHVLKQLKTLLCPRQIPTWYVSEALTLALLQTDFPEKLDWKQLTMPMPGMALMFPITRETYFAMNGRYIPYVLTGRVHYDIAEAPQEELDRQLVLMSIQDRNYDPMDISLNVSLGDELNEAISSPMRFVDNPAVYLPISKVPEEEAIARDKEALQLVMRLITGTIAVMNARPELVETQTKPEFMGKKSKDKDRKEFWAANTVGWKYKSVDKSTGPKGTHASPRWHWTRGYFRQQPYGPKMTLRKVVWIEPYTSGVMS